MATVCYFCKFQLGEEFNAKLKKVGIYPQNGTHHISNFPYTIKFASKLKLMFNTFIRWDGLICRLLSNLHIHQY